jgi:hypothetical protein
MLSRTHRRLAYAAPPAPVRLTQEAQAGAAGADAAATART